MNYFKPPGRWRQRPAYEYVRYKCAMIAAWCQENKPHGSQLKVEDA